MSLNEAIDTETPLGKFFFTVVAAFAELERNVIRERVRDGIKRARQQGKRLGRPTVVVDREKIRECAAASVHRVTCQRVADRSRHGAGHFGPWQGGEKSRRKRRRILLKVRATP